ncbi:hypothetical protein O6H91_14G062200 [Diphasiastrum complanatum]|uniref:Uncharacterized protein n=1 Tax=Diphasiastrum complanatum TaxID=34168 RepID=A0ACC2BQ66_DIPCM|nr:hypothetical protein O6H91_14G062200 [Diphasiastrum complanatum]
MAGKPFSPPDIMEFSIGVTEQKFDHQAFLKTKQPRTHRIPIKQWNRMTTRHAARSALQKSVAYRSSALRQGKFAEARSQNGESNFAATKAAGVRALMAPVLTNRNWGKDSDVSRRNSLIQKRTDLGEKVLKLYTVAAEDINVPIIDITEK